MLDSASKRLVDAQNADLDADSQFDLAYGAAHRFALAALRREGYRSENNRLTVFQTLAHTVGTANADLQVFPFNSVSASEPQTLSPCSALGCGSVGAARPHRWWRSKTSIRPSG